MEKNEFIDRFRKRILLGAFDYDAFLTKEDLVFRERKLPISCFGKFFCPWYYLGNKIIKFSYALDDSRVQVMKVSDNEIINQHEERRKIIAAYQRQKFDYLLPVLLAIDLATDRVLLLDSNKTTIAWYRNYLEDQKNKNIMVPVVEIAGKNLETIIGDFHIVNRFLKAESPRC